MDNITLSTQYSRSELLLWPDGYEVVFECGYDICPGDNLVYRCMADTGYYKLYDLLGNISHVTVSADSTACASGGAIAITEGHAKLVVGPTLALYKLVFATVEEIISSSATIDDLYDALDVYSVCEDDKQQIVNMYLNNDIDDELAKKLDKTGGVITGDLTIEGKIGGKRVKLHVFEGDVAVTSGDVHVQNGGIAVTDLFFGSASMSSGGIVIETEEGKITLSIHGGLCFEDTMGNVKRLGGVDYVIEPDPSSAVMFSDMEEYVEEATQVDNHTIIYNKDNKLSVNTADEVGDNTLPITAAAVNTTVGNIEVLLKTL